MEISRQKSGDLLVLRLQGRLDANWCGHVQDALSSAVKDGEHRIQLDMASVTYLSSAGLRVLMTVYKQLRGISGEFGVLNPSPAVRSVLELSGLGVLIGHGASAVATGVEETGETRTTTSANWKVFATTSPSATMKLQAMGDAAVLANGVSDPQAMVSFCESAVALGVGVLGGAAGDQVTRAGEFMAVSGVAAYQPADGSSRPDFMICEGSLVPQGQLMVGLLGDGGFARLARFESKPEARSTGLTELAETALTIAGGDAAVVVAVTETAGLVGATLRRSPGAKAEPSAAGGWSGGGLGPRFEFPEIREWLSFTSERAFRDSASLIVGVVARRGSPFESLLRPLGMESQLVGHFHAAAFSYRPLRKGRIELKATVRDLFEGLAPQAIMHLLCDPRGFNGAGESEFLRGALWIAPVATT